MSNPLFTTFPAESQSSDALAELALNLRWSWSHTAAEIWGRLDPDLWELTQNPWLVLQTVSQEKLQAAWADPAFKRRVEESVQQAQAVRQVPGLVPECASERTAQAGRLFQHGIHVE